MKKCSLRLKLALFAYLALTCSHLKANDFETIAETNIIQGPPSLSLTESRANWESACEKWKNEIRDLNREHQILFLDCGLPEEIKKEHQTRLFQSKGTVKLRVKTGATPSESEE
jgi:hypothetical protein